MMSGHVGIDHHQNIFPSNGPAISTWIMLPGLTWLEPWMEWSWHWSIKYGLTGLTFLDIVLQILIQVNSGEYLHPSYAWMDAMQLLNNGVGTAWYRDDNSVPPQQNLSMHCQFLKMILELLKIFTCVGWPSKPDELVHFTEDGVLSCCACSNWQCLDLANYKL